MNTANVLAPEYFGRLQRPYLQDLLADQHLGGGLSWGLGEVPIVVVLGIVLVRWMRADDREARRRDRAADRAGEGHDELAAYNAYLASLDRGSANSPAVNSPDRGA